MIKKVIVPAAGKGTRMLHLSKDRPKHLINVNGKPFLFYVLDNLKNAGFEEIILVIGYQKEHMEKFVSEHNFPVKVVNQFELLGEDKYGTACPIMAVENIIGKENFLSVSGDNLYSLKDIKAMMIDDEYNYVAGLEVSDPEKYGVLISDHNDFLKEIVEKPKKFVGNIINSGMYKFTPEVFEKVKEIKKSPRGEYEVTDVITLLARESKVKIKIIQDFWHDFGNPDDVIKIAKFLKENSKTYP